MFKGTYFFSQPTLRQGWSESYYVDTDNHDEGMDLMKGLANYRMALSAGTTYLDAIRVSNTDHPRDSKMEFFNGVPQQCTGSKSTTSDVGWTSILVQLISTPRYKNHKFLRGIPDSAVTVPLALTTPVLNLSAGYLAAMQGYEMFLVANPAFKVKCKGDLGTVFANIGKVQVVRVTSRKVGRPFGQRRGRPLPKKVVP